MSVQEAFEIAYDQAEREALIACGDAELVAEADAIMAAEAAKDYDEMMAHSRVAGWQS